MTYSLDLRERVVAFVREGGSKFEAERRFHVKRQTIYNWLSKPDLAPSTQKRRRRRKLDWAALKRHVELHPDKLLRERAVEFGVNPHSIWNACKEMQLTHKKSLEI
jgi:putative transposase